MDLIADEFSAHAASSLVLRMIIAVQAAGRIIPRLQLSINRMPSKMSTRGLSTQRNTGIVDHLRHTRVFGAELSTIHLLGR